MSVEKKYIKINNGVGKRGVVLDNS
jgi:hypothetical protein